MKIIALLLACAAVASAAIVRPAPMPSTWRASSAHLSMTASGLVEVMVPLKPTQDQRDMLAEIAYAVSDPDSEHYGKHLTAEQANAVTAPTKASLDAVVSWLSTDVSARVEVAAGGNTVRATMSVAGAMRTFSTSFREYTEVNVGANAPRTVRHATAYAVPEHLEDVVEHVYGLHGLPLPVTDKRVVGAGTPPAVTPSVLEEAYGIKGVKPSGSLKNRQAVAEFQGQTMNVTDLAKFFELYVPKADQKDDKVYKFHGEPKQGGEGIEALLDIQAMMGLSPGIKTEFYEQMSADFCSDLKNWTTLLLSASDIPNVHSISYGWQGNLTRLQCTDAKVKDIDLDYQKLAARGISIIFASGDSGSGYTPPQPPMPHCSDPPSGEHKDSAYEGTPARTLRFGNTQKSVLEKIMAEECCQICGEERLKAWSVAIDDTPAPPPPPGPPSPPHPPIFFADCKLYASTPKTVKKTGSFAGVAPTVPPTPHGNVQPLWPSWPASSPWITAVGATRFHNDKVSTDAQDAVSSEDHFGSGGGFSTMFKAPKYQEEAIAKYFKTVPASTLPNPKVATYPRGGRGTPDVAALGTGYPVVVAGRVNPGVGGTSASTPVFAAIVSLLNEERIKAGDKPLGFLNPFIYKNAAVWKDVTIGSDKVGRGGFPLQAGFNCTAGWDPVTGLGTPIFEKLLAAAKKE